MTDDERIIERLRDLYRAVTDVADGPPTSASPEGASRPHSSRRSRRTIGAVLLTAAASVAMLVLVRPDDRGAGITAAPDPASGTVAASPSTQPSDVTDDPYTAGRATAQPLPAAPEAVSGVPTCGRVPPLGIAIPAATSEGAGPAPGRPPNPGQYAWHWTTPTGTFEVLWPPDPRELYATSGPSGEASGADWPTSSSGNDSTPRSAVFESGGPDTVVVTVGAAAPASASGVCATVELRRVSATGTSRSGVHWPDFMLNVDGGPLLDLGPLIFVRSTRTDHVDPGYGIQCAKADGAPIVVDDGPVEATPAEALRSFLVTDRAFALRTTVPSPRRTFDEYHLTETDSYQYEQFVNWNQHLTVVVEHVAAGYAVTSVRTALC